MMRHRLLMLAAASVSTIGVGMAAAAALERGMTLADRVLIVAASVAITLGAHLLPAITRRAAGLGLWLVCMALTVYGHAVFFGAAAQRAGEHRAQTVAPGAHDAALREQLQGLTRRPVSAVAADLAAAQARAAGGRLALARCEQATPGRCAASAARAEQQAGAVAALQAERSESDRAEAIRQQLAVNAGRLDTQRQAAAMDPIAAQLATATGVSADSVTLLLSVMCATVVELLAALLWAEALRREPVETASWASPIWRARGQAQAKAPGALAPEPSHDTGSTPTQPANLAAWRRPDPRASPDRRRPDRPPAQAGHVMTTHQTKRGAT